MFLTTVYISSSAIERGFTLPTLEGKYRTRQSDLSANAAKMEAMGSHEEDPKGQDTAYGADSDDTTAPTHEASSRVAPGAVTFFAVGDWGNGGAKRQRLVARSMAAWAEKRRPDFIISTGDNMYDYGVKDVHDRQFKVTFEDVYSDPGLKGIPWWMSLGNHDHGYRKVVRDVMAQVNYTAVSPTKRLSAIEG